jgi:hypothetical protein
MPIEIDGVVAVSRRANKNLGYEKTFPSSLKLMMHIFWAKYNGTSWYVVQRTVERLIPRLN